VPAAAPTALWCLPGCGQSCAAWPPPATSLLRPDGRHPPKVAGERPTERSEGFTFGTPVLGREVIRCPGTWTRRISGAILGDCFFWFFPSEKGWCYFSSSKWAKISLSITYKKFLGPNFNHKRLSKLHLVEPPSPTLTPPQNVAKKTNNAFHNITMSIAAMYLTRNS
jgi:hypothetical protein